MKKLIALCMAAIMMTGLLSGCGNSSSEGYNKDGIKKTLVIGTDSDITTLDLQKQQDQVNNLILKNTHQTLVYFTNEQTFRTGLATSWEFIDDTHIRFNLREDVTFSDGTPFTAEDVVFTYEMAVNPESGSKVDSILKGMVSIKALNEYTVEIEIDKYNNEFVASLASMPIGIQSKAAYESGMEEPYHIGTGPYKFAEWVEGEYCRLEKVENYWGETASDIPDYYRPGVVETIDFRPILEPNARVNALETGEIDVCTNPPIQLLSKIQEMEGVKVVEEDGTRLFYLGFNTEHETWSNQMLRQAVACAIDRDAVIDASVHGKGKTQTTILNRGLWSFYDDMEGFDYDVERGKQLMAEAGYPGADSENLVLTTKLTYAKTGSYEQQAIIIQACLREIGIDVQLNGVDEPELKQICENGEQELFLWRWNEDSKIDFVYRDLYYTDSENNYHHYSDPKVDELTDAVLYERKEILRYEMSVELQTYLVDACPQVPLYVADLVIAYDENLKDAYLFGGGNHVWSHAYVQKAE